MDLKRGTIILQLLILSLHGSLAGEAPQFTAQPSDVIVAPSGTVVLECGASGTPQPTVTWYKDELQITLSGRIVQGASGDLQISDVRSSEPSDAGLYHCVASNTAGSVRSLTAELRIAFINAVPSTVSDHEQTPTRNNDPRVLNCHVPTSLPGAVVTWFRRGNALGESDLADRLGITRDGRLVFSAFTSSDTGVYSCQVGNDVVGSTQPSSSYILTLDESGSTAFIETDFVAMPTPQTVVAGPGTTAELECFTTGSPVATVSWRKDGSPLSASARVSFQQGGRILTIRDVSAGDGGSYTCVATQSTNMGPSTEEVSATLTVIEPPTIAESFPETPVFVTQSASLTCRTSQGTTPLSWTWRLNGQDIVSSERVAFDAQGVESTFTITSVVAGDEGVYQCEVRNQGGVATANELLVAQTSPPTFTHGSLLQDTLVFVGTTVMLPCTAEGFPPPVFSWTMGGQEVNFQQQARYSLPPPGTGDGTLTIASSTQADSAVYICRASNSISSVTTSPIQLRVIAPPTVLLSPQSVVPNPGDDPVLPCAVSTPADVTEEYGWTKDGAPLALTNRITVAPGSGDLTITDIMDSDNGVYECLVSLSVAGLGATPLPEVVGSAIVTVGDPPEPPSLPLGPSITPTTLTAQSVSAQWTPPTSNGGLQLASYTIEVLNMGSSECPQAEPEWEPILTDVPHTDNVVEAMVQPLQPHSQYRFRVVAVNSGGLESDPSVPSSAFQTLQAAPLAPPTNVAAVSAGEGQLMVSWAPPTNCSTHNGVLTDYTLRYQSVGGGSVQELQTDGDTFHHLTDLLPLTMYELQVAAHTEEGRGPFSSVVMETTAGETPPGAPQDLEATLLNSTAIKLTWAPPLQGTVVAYVVSYTGSPSGSGSLNVAPDELCVVIPGLEPGVTYCCSVTAQNSEGMSFTDTVCLLIPPDPGPQATSPTSQFYQETWFIAVVVVGGALGLGVLVAIIACICCCKCGSKEGKIYITSRRSNSSLSGASSGFSEYQHKHKVMSRFVKVHSSPTPSRRTQDYADLESFRSGRHQPNGAPPSFSYPDSLMSAGTESQQDHYPPNLEMHRGTPFSMQAQFDPTTPLPAINSQDGYDHIPMSSMINGTGPVTMATLAQLPSPPPQFIPAEHSPLTHSSSPSPTPLSQPSGRGKGLSQDSEDSWSPADCLNYRGHMTGREPSMKSATSVTSVESNGSIDPRPTSKAASAKSWEFRAPNKAGVLEPRPSTSRQNSTQNGRHPLPPLQEHRSMEGGLDHAEEYSSYSVPSRARSPPYGARQYSRSLEQRKQNAVQDSPPRYSSLSPKPGMEAEHHVQQGPIPNSLPGSRMKQEHRQHSVPNNPDPLRYTPRPLFQDRSFSQPQHHHVHANIHIPRTPSPQDVPDMGPRQSNSYGGSHHHGMEHREPGMRMQNGVQHRQASMEKELNPRVAQNLVHQQMQETRAYPSPRTDVRANIMYPGPGMGPNPGPGMRPNPGPGMRPNPGPGMRPNPGPNFDGRQQPNFIQNFDSRQPLPPPPQHSMHVSMPQLDPRGRQHPCHGNDAPNLQLGYGIPEQRSQPLLYRPPEVQGGPPTDYYHQHLDQENKVERSSYPDVVHNSTNAGGHLGLAPPPEAIPDLGQIDARRPKLKKTKVPRQVWEPRPMNRAVESSSESDGDNYSESSFGAGEGDTTSLKSSHV